MDEDKIVELNKKIFQPEAKILVATPNYTNLFSSEVHANHIECVAQWKKEKIDFNWTIIGRTFVHFARSQACQAAINGDYTHIFWVDDDAVIDPDILQRFLSYDKEIVIAPYPMRRQPHEIGVLFSTVGDFHNHKSYRNLTMDDMGQGLIEVDGGGTHCMLVKTEVLRKKGDIESSDAYPKPLLDFLDTLSEDQKETIDHYVGNLPDESLTLKEEDDLGKPYFMMPKTGTEDMYFCYRAKKKGVKIWCDTDVFASHIGFYPVIGKEHTERAEMMDNEGGESRGGIPVLQVQQGPTQRSNNNEELSGVRKPSVDTSKSASLV